MKRIKQAIGQFENNINLYGAIRYEFQAVPMPLCLQTPHQQEKEMSKTATHCNTRPGGHRGHGPSSFWMQEPAYVFDALGIVPGERVLDLGCGAGEYTLTAARLVGASGHVTALDHWPPIVTAMENAARAAGLPQICALQADITCPPLPVQDNDMDLCLLFTVLHIFTLDRHKGSLYREMARVLKPGGRLAVLECKKEEMPFGPPIYMRLSPDEVEASLKEYGFNKTGYMDLGYNYLIQFALES